MSLLPSPRVAKWALVVYCLAVVAIVFEPVPIFATGSVTFGHGFLMRLGAPHWITASVVEFAWNIAMFVPLTFLGSIVKPRVTWQRWVGLGLLASSTIEFVQLLAFPHRTASLSDIVSNTLGALLGVVAARALARRKEQQRERIGYVEDR